MQCKKCGFDNETTQAYCKLCGGRLSFTIGRAESALLDKATNESAARVEEELRKMLVAAICIFVLLLTLKFVFGRGSWSSVYLVPATSTTADYAALTYVYEPAGEPWMDSIPLEK